MSESSAVEQAERAHIVVSDLSVGLASNPDRTVVRDINFDIRAGEVLGLVGESGSGKTSTGLALLGFARKGLRQLYFLLGGLLDRLVYLKYGIAAILAFIGVKLVLHALHENELAFINGGEPVPVPEISTWMSLAFIVLAMAVATIASIIKMRKDAAERGERLRLGAREL